MNYSIARNGELRGSYSLLQLQRHLVSGEVLHTDLAQAEGMEEWVPVAEIFPAPPTHHAAQSAMTPKLFRDPPDLRWWIVLLLGLATFNIFSVIWDLYEALWLRSVNRRSIALWFYLVSAAVFIIKLQGTWHSMLYNVGLGPAPDESYAMLFTLATILLAIVSRLVLRRELLDHFNHREALGLRLNWLLSFLFGGLYFQYHFNRINERKRSLRLSVPAL